MQPLCGDCEYMESLNHSVCECSWLWKRVPPEGAKVAKLPWVGDGRLYDYIVECPQFKPYRRRRKKRNYEDDLL